MAVALGAAWGLKRHYSLATAEELRWILQPTTALTQVVLGSDFAFRPGEGYLSRELSILISPACAGVNFLIASVSIARVRLRAGASRLATAPARARSSALPRLPDDVAGQRSAHLRFRVGGTPSGAFLRSDVSQRSPAPRHRRLPGWIDGPLSDGSSLAVQPNACDYAPFQSDHRARVLSRGDAPGAAAAGRRAQPRVLGTRSAGLGSGGSPRRNAALAGAGESSTLPSPSAGSRGNRHLAGRRPNRHDERGPRRTVRARRPHSRSSIRARASAGGIVCPRSVRSITIAREKPSRVIASATPRMCSRLKSFEPVRRSRAFPSLNRGRGAGRCGRGRPDHPQRAPGAGTPHRTPARRLERRLDSRGVSAARSSLRPRSRPRRRVRRRRRVRGAPPRGRRAQGRCVRSLRARCPPGSAPPRAGGAHRAPLGSSMARRRSPPNESRPGHRAAHLRPQRPGRTPPPTLRRPDSRLVAASPSPRARSSATRPRGSRSLISRRRLLGSRAGSADPGRRERRRTFERRVDRRYSGRRRFLARASTQLPDPFGTRRSALVVWRCEIAVRRQRLTRIPQTPGDESDRSDHDEASGQQPHERALCPAAPLVAAAKHTAPVGARGQAVDLTPFRHARTLDRPARRREAGSRPVAWRRGELLDHTSVRAAPEAGFVHPRHLVRPDGVRLETARAAG